MAAVVKLGRSHLRKGDMVEVVGGKFRGKRGRVLQILADRSRAVVEGVNVVKRHVKPNRKVPQGGIVEKEAPLPTARLMVVCSKCGEASRTGHRFLADGSKVRYCKRCGEQVEK